MDFHRKDLLHDSVLILTQRNCVRVYVIDLLQKDFPHNCCVDLDCTMQRTPFTPYICIGETSYTILCWFSHTTMIAYAFYARDQHRKHTHSCVDFHTAQCWRMHLRHGSASESPLTRSCVDSHRFVGVAPSCIAQWTGLSVFAPSCIAQCCTVNWFVFAPSCIAQWTGLSLSAPSCIAQWTGLSLFVQAALHSKLVCQCFI